MKNLYDDGLIIKEAFSMINSGLGWHQFKNLITDQQDIQHQKHVEKIEEFKGELFKYRNLVLETFGHTYIPDISSSSFTMIRAILSMYENFNQYHHILEIGAGSGIVSMVLNEHHTAQKFTCTDICDNAIRALKRNVTSNKLDNFSIIQSDLFENLGTNTYDAIIFNPPLWHKEINIIDGADMALIDPHGLLFDSFFAQVDKHLTKDGIIFIAFSNLGKSSLIEKNQDKWIFTLITVEFIAKTGVMKAIYAVKRRV
jgi:methylase of polypeptide subunit release factors